MEHEEHWKDEERGAPAFATASSIDDGTNVFRGRFGLRAVWAILLFLALFIAATVVSTVVVRIAEHKSPFPKHTETTAPVQHDMKPGETLLNDGPTFALVLFVTWGLSRIERRKLGVYGIGRARRTDFLPGALWGFVCLSALVMALKLTHVLVFDGRALSGSAIYISGARWLLAFLTVGLVEEYLCRGFFQYTLTRGLFTMAERVSPRHARVLAFWAAAIIMSCLFGAGHLANPGETAPGILAVFLAGIVFSYALWWTGSLWWAIGFHMTWDWAQSFFYGVPDSGYLSAGRLFQTHPAGSIWLSGGKAGPEGSLLVLPTLLLVVVIVRLTTKRAAEQPDLYPQNLPREASVNHSLQENNFPG